MLDLSTLSCRYAVRALTDADVDAMAALAAGNDQFYRYYSGRPTPEAMREDLRLLPPDTDPAQKHYVGFFEGERMVALLDLIDGYPDADTAYLGFFMLERGCQGRGVGTALYREIEAALRRAGKQRVRLAINKGNPQSTHFWTKQGFSVLKEVVRDDGAFLVAEKAL